jgi:hypothetical protein
MAYIVPSKTVEDASTVKLILSPISTSGLYFPGTENSIFIGSML